MFYITFHKTESNIWAYDDSGNLKTQELLQVPLSTVTKLDELRGMTFGPNGYLYVVNSDKSQSQVLVYTGNGDTDYAYSFVGIYADPTVSKGIAHPFALAFDGNGNGYVSSQDTNVVTALSPNLKATPLQVASFLQHFAPPLGPEEFLPGTFVASCYGALNGVTPPPPNVPTPQGLDLDPPQGPASHSVRDVVVIGEVLYVADEPGNAVKKYSLVNIPLPGTQGQLQGQITNASLQGPVHLLVNNGSLYITSSDSILVCDLQGGAVTTFLSGLHSPTGMAFGPGGNFFFADRKDQVIYQSVYDSNTKQYGQPTVFIPKYDKKNAPDGLQDEPEFLVHVNTPA